MSELIEINAELLKWCKTGFKFKAFGLVNWWTLGVCDGENIWEVDGTKMRYAGLSMSAIVAVNPAEYEKAVIEKIKEMFNYVHSIQKLNGCVYVNTGTFEYSKRKGRFLSNGGLYTKVNADPRPWDDEYTIIMQEE